MARQARRQHEATRESELRAAAWAPIFVALEQFGITQAAAAAELGCPRQSLTYYKQGVVRPPEWVIRRLCKLSGVSHRQILAAIEQSPASRAFYLQPASLEARPAGSGRIPRAFLFDGGDDGSDGSDDDDMTTREMEHPSHERPTRPTRTNERYTPALAARRAR